MIASEVVPTDMRVRSEQIYQYKKGVRNMVLYTFPDRYQQQAIDKLERQKIDYLVQPIGNKRINLFFGRRECMDVVRTFIDQPLHQLSPEEDFILGALLGYDICGQCKRFCKLKI